MSKKYELKFKLDLFKLILLKLVKENEFKSLKDLVFNCIEGNILQQISSGV